MASGEPDFALRNRQKSFAVSAITFLAEIHDFVRGKLAGDGDTWLWMAKNVPKIGYSDFARSKR
jgi:hypothetical protein